VKRAILSPAADADIDALAAHIAATQSLPAAERFIDAIYETCVLLATHPDSTTDLHGHARQVHDVAPSEREVAHAALERAGMGRRHSELHLER